jgi:hypothetical protein
MPFEDAAGLAEAWEPERLAGDIPLEEAAAGLWEPERLAGGMAAEERFAAPPTDCAP